MKKRALILLGGTMKGAYTVGVMRTFYDKLGPTFFDTIYSRSVGVFEQAFFASNQPGIMEHTWHEYVDQNKFISFRHLFMGKPVIDLDYLIKLFRSAKSPLKVTHMVESPIHLFCFVCEKKTHEPVMFNLKVGNVFDIMEASSAMPYLFHPVKIDGKYYVDGAWADKKKWAELMEKIYTKFDEIVVVLNKNTDENFVPPNPKLKFIKPSRMPLRYPFDTNKKRIIATIEQGKADALEFLKNYTN